MIDVEEVPRSGILILTVYFKGYKDYYQNDTRRCLKDRIPKIDTDNNLKIDLKPIQFSLVKKITAGLLERDVTNIDKENMLELDFRVIESGLIKTVSGKSSRATGAQYQYSYKNMTPEKFKILYREIKKIFDGYSWWDDFDLLIASNVGGLE